MLILLDDKKWWRIWYLLNKVLNFIFINRENNIDKIFFLIVIDYNFDYNIYILEKRFLKRVFWNLRL